MSTPTANPQLMLAGLSRRALAASLLIAFLLLAHVALMATEQHAAAMGATHSLHSGMVTTLTTLGASHHANTETGHHQAPTTVLGDCPAQQAILPLFLLVVLVLFATGQIGWRPTYLRQFPQTTTPLLPLALHRRLALLQVLLI